MVTRNETTFFFNLYLYFIYLQKEENLQTHFTYKKGIAIDAKKIRYFGSLSISYVILKTVDDNNIAFPDQISGVWIGLYNFQVKKFWLSTLNLLNAIREKNYKYVHTLLISS